MIVSDKKFLMSDKDGGLTRASSIERQNPFSHIVKVGDSTMELNGDLDVTFTYTTNNPNLTLHKFIMPIYAALDLMEAMKIYQHTSDAETPKEIFGEMK